MIQRDARSRNPEALFDSCQRLNLNSLLVDGASDDLPETACDRQVLFWGSCDFVASMMKSGKWKPGAYLDDSLFCYSEYMKRYGSHMLNSDAWITTPAELSASPLEDGKRYFLRCDSDMKRVPGSLWRASEVRQFVEKLVERGDPESLSMPLIVASRKLIDNEWRVFLVDGRVVAATQYRHLGDVEYSSSVADSVKEFVAKMAAIWSPAPVVVMDVASAGDDLFVLELNGFNSSGFYAADVGAIVREVTEFAEREG